MLRTPRHHLLHIAIQGADPLCVLLHSLVIFSVSMPVLLPHWHIGSLTFQISPGCVHHFAAWWKIGKFPVSRLQDTERLSGLVIATSTDATFALVLVALDTLALDDLERAWRLALRSSRTARPFSTVVASFVTKTLLALRLACSFSLYVWKSPSTPRMRAELFHSSTLEPCLSTLSREMGKEQALRCWGQNTIRYTTHSSLNGLLLLVSPDAAAAAVALPCSDTILYPLFAGAGRGFGSISFISLADYSVYRCNPCVSSLYSFTSYPIP